MQPLTNPELIKEFTSTFPTSNPANLTKLFDNDEFLCYKDIQTNINYLYDIKLQLWIKESTEFWRTVPLT